MVIRLKSVLKNQILILAFKALIFGFFLYLYNSNPGFVWGSVFLLAAFWLYSRPFFNWWSLFFPFISLITTALWIGFEKSWLSNPALLLVAVSFGVILGLKNFILTHRHYWHYLISFFTSYLLFLNFFNLDKSNFFWLKWLSTILLLFFLFKDLLIPKVSTWVLILFLGEMLWIVSWLPIGFLSSSSLLMLSMFFLVDSLANERISWKNLILFILLVAIVLSSSYWRI